LVRFNAEYSIAEESWNGFEKELVRDVYKRPRNYDFKEALLLEVRDPDQDFDVYTSLGIILAPNLISSKMSFLLSEILIGSCFLGLDLVFRAMLTDYDKELLIRTQEVHATPQSTLGELKAKLAKLFQIENRDLAISLRLRTRSRLLTDDSRALNTFGLYRFNEVRGGSEDWAYNIYLTLKYLPNKILICVDPFRRRGID
jgi:hypothetical protein